MEGNIISISKTLINSLSGYFDCLYESDCLSDEEKEDMNQLEDDITDYIHKLEDENNRLRQQLEKGETNESTDNKNKRN